MGKSIVSGMSQRVTFGVRRSENLESLPVALFPPVSRVQSLKITGVVLSAASHLRIGQRAVWPPDGDGLDGHEEFRQCGRAV